MIFDDRCMYRHDCDWAGHQQAALPQSPARTIVIDYRFRCDECGQRWHVTGHRYPQGSGESHGDRIRKPSRKWRKAQRHPRNTDNTDSPGSV